MYLIDYLSLTAHQSVKNQWNESSTSRVDCAVLVSPAGEGFLRESIHFSWGTYWSQNSIVESYQVVAFDKQIHIIKEINCW
jgi:hypothetical protein